MLSDPEIKLAELKSNAKKADTAYQQALAKIEAQREAVRSAAQALKDLGVSSVAEAEVLVAQLTEEAEAALAEAQAVIE